MRFDVLTTLFFLLSLLSLHAAAERPVFSEARVAAKEERFEDVITMLTNAIDTGELTDEERAIAFSNRGIASSLLQDYEHSRQDLARAIELLPDHALTLNHLGILSEHIDANYERAARWYRKAADLGYPASRVNLANLYRFGLGVEQNLELAVSLYQAAVDDDYPAARVALGEMYMDGRGIGKDYKKGLALLRQGVEQGVVTGHYYLGLAYERGEGVARDYAMAYEHLRTAALQGHAPSQGELGFLYRKGYGVEKNFIEAVRWYGLAAEQGDVVASNRLAWLLATCPVDAVCNPGAAVELAKYAAGQDPSPTNMDSLAAAYARLGDFDRATGVIRDVMAMPQLSEAAREKYTRRLERYRNGIPFQL